MLYGMNSSKATGVDHLPARLIKNGASVIAGPMIHIIHLSLGVGRVPVDMKLARVVPLHKTKLIAKLRWVIIGRFQYLTKVIEIIVFNQLNEYLVNNK